MPRPRHIMPPILRDAMQLNGKTSLYEIEQDGITYYLTFEQMNQVKQFFNLSGTSSYKMERWYKSLSHYAQKEIKRSGKLPAQDDGGFYPDAEFCDL